MTDPNDKWVWADEADSSPQASPLLEKKLEPIIQWADPEPILAVPEPAAGTEIAAPPETAPAPGSDLHQLDTVVESSQGNARRDIPASVVKATVLHLEGQYEHAIQELEAGLRNREPETELYAAMGALQMDLERFEDAAASFTRVLEREPGNETSKHNLALCQDKLKERKKPPKPPQSLVKAIVLHMEGKIDEAIKELQRGVKSGENTSDVYAALGHLQFEAGRFDAAAESYTQVLEREPLHRTCHYNLAVCLEKTGRHKEALGSFERAFKINPQRVEFGIGVGVSLLHLRRFAEAEAAFEACLKTHPDDMAGLFGKAYALQCQSQHAEAETAYLEALNRDPAQEETLLNLIALAREQDNHAASRKYSEKLLAIRPESKVALQALMAADLAEGSYEAACSLGERLIHTAPDEFETWFNYGIACKGARRAEHAAAAFSKAARIRPKSLEALASLGAALQERGDLAGAKSAYESALKLSPDHPAVMWNLVLVAEQSGNVSEAERLCAALASKSPDAEAVLFRLASLRFQRGDYLGSANAFRGCLKAQPDWPAAQFNLGLALWKSGNREEARQKLESVNGSFSSDALHSLALIALEREDYQCALGHYKKLAEAGERTPELFYNTGLILQNLGRQEEAAQQYREALAVKPDLDEAAQALAQISKGPARVEEIRRSVRKEPSPAPRLLKSR
jgi:tetratricopeptide (TPR) repeat protein